MWKAPVPIETTRVFAMEDCVKVFWFATEKSDAKLSTQRVCLFHKTLGKTYRCRELMLLVMSRIVAEISRSVCILASIFLTEARTVAWFRFS